MKPLSHLLFSIGLKISYVFKFKEAITLLMVNMSVSNHPLGSYLAN